MSEKIYRSFDFSGHRHWLSDCRPDLVEHEIGEACTWSSDPAVPYERRCYAYLDERRQVTPNHVHFYADGPMVYGMLGSIVV